jgi:hypothetical protein
VAFRSLRTAPRGPLRAEPPQASLPNVRTIQTESPGVRRGAGRPDRWRRSVACRGAAGHVCPNSIHASTTSAMANTSTAAQGAELHRRALLETAGRIITEWLCCPDIFDVGLLGCRSVHQSGGMLGITLGSRMKNSAFLAKSAQSMGQRTGLLCGTARCGYSLARLAQERATAQDARGPGCGFVDEGWSTSLARGSVGPSPRQPHARLDQRCASIPPLTACCLATTRRVGAASPGMGTAAWSAVGLGVWLLAGLWLALAFGRAARDDPTAPRHEPEVQRRLSRRKRQRMQPQPAGNRGQSAQSGQQVVTSASSTFTANR